MNVGFSFTHNKNKPKRKKQNYGYKNKCQLIGLRAQCTTIDLMNDYISKHRACMEYDGVATKKK